jgi:hypothetical protein
MNSTTVRVTFRRSFTVKGLEGTVPPGTYRLETEEEEIDGLSFVALRCLATFLWLPVAGRGAGSSQGVRVDPKDVEEALRRDAIAPPPRPNHQDGT